MRTLLVNALSLPAFALADPGHGDPNAFHGHGAELLLALLVLIGLAVYLLRR